MKTHPYLLFAILVTFVISLGNFIGEFEGNMGDDRRRFWIPIFLFLSVIPLFFNRKFLVCFGGLFLFIVQLFYGYWLLGTYQGVTNAANLSYDKIPHVLFLGNANYVDVFVWLSSVICLFFTIRQATERNKI